MTWQAHIEDRWQNDTLAVHLIDRFGGGYRLLGKGGDTVAVVTDPSAVAREPSEPALLIPAEASHALLASLARHLGAVEHPEQLRRDYEAERGRVDRFIAHLTTGGTP